MVSYKDAGCGKNCVRCRLPPPPGRLKCARRKRQPLGEHRALVISRLTVRVEMPRDSAVSSVVMPQRNATPAVWYMPSSTAL